AFSQRHRNAAAKSTFVVANVSVSDVNVENRRRVNPNEVTLRIERCSSEIKNAIGITNRLKSMTNKKMGRTKTSKDTSKSHSPTRNRTMGLHLITLSCA